MIAVAKTSLFLLCFLLINLCCHAFFIASKKDYCRKSYTLLSSNSASLGDDEAISKCGPCKFAPKCSGEYSTKGCDGSGKIQGGIATVPLLSWWPIKVYRPCPSYLAAGYVYRREGQTLDQVLFSEPSTKMKEKIEALRQQKEQEEEEVQRVQKESQSKSVADDAVEAIWNERKKKP